jgi:hypothetical protein
MIALSGVHSMDRVRDDADNLAHRHLEVAEQLGGLQTRFKDNVRLIAQHLYIADGDSEAQDAIFQEIESN